MKVEELLYHYLIGYSKFQDTNMKNNIVWALFKMYSVDEANCSMHFPLKKQKATRLFTNKDNRKLKALWDGTMSFSHYL